MSLLQQEARLFQEFCVHSNGGGSSGIYFHGGGGGGGAGAGADDVCPVFATTSRRRRRTTCGLDVDNAIRGFIWRERGTERVLLT